MYGVYYPTISEDFEDVKSIKIKKSVGGKSRHNPKGWSIFEVNIDGNQFDIEDIHIPDALAGDERYRKPLKCAIVEWMMGDGEDISDRISLVCTEDDLEQEVYALGTDEYLPE